MGGAQTAIRPGGPQGTNPDARVQQLYATEGLQGGFVVIDVEPATDEREATLAVRFFDEWGRLTWRYAAGG